MTEIETQEVVSQNDIFTLEGLDRNTAIVHEYLFHGLKQIDIAMVHSLKEIKKL